MEQLACFSDIFGGAEQHQGVALLDAEGGRWAVDRPVLADNADDRCAGAVPQVDFHQAGAETGGVSGNGLVFKLSSRQD